MNPALVFCVSAHVSEMGGDYNFEKRCNLAVHQNRHAMSVLMNLAQDSSRKSLQQSADAEIKALEESIQAEIRALEVLMPRLGSFVFRSSPADPRSMALSGGSFRHFSPQLFRPLFLVIPLLH